MNRVVLVGRIATDPELRFTPAGLAVAEFRLAVRDPFRKETAPDGRERAASDFFTVKVWRERAEYAANYLGKGTLVALHGRLSVDEWQTDQGQKRRDLYITADQLESWG